MRLYLMKLATSAGSGAPVPGYLIQADDGTNVLVDTGFPRDRALLPEGARSGFVVEPGQHAVEQLARIGIAPGDVQYVVLTHMDIDHAGCNPDFPDAELVVQRRHYEAGLNGLQRLQVLRPYWDRPELRYRLVDGDTTLLPGIDLIESSGHVVGHQAVLVRLRETGPVLLAADAISRPEHMDADTRPIGMYDEDAAATRASTRKLLDLAAREDVKLIVRGHDAEQWASLRLLPELYA